MGGTNTTYAVARTSVTIVEGIDMSKLLDEIRAEIEAAKPPNDAITAKQVAEDNDIGNKHAVDILTRKVEEEGWVKTKYKGTNYYWKPAP